MAAAGLAFLAGILSILSPCVLPILPLVLGSAVSQSRLGPAALAAGLAVSFVTVGLFVATIGFSIGLDGGVFRFAGAILMAGLGLILLVPGWQAALSMAASPVASWGQANFGHRLSGQGLGGQFAVGLLLGMVWSPCVGPTLGAASVLAAQGRDLGQVGATMAAFGLGAAAPLLILGILSRPRLLAVRHRLQSAGSGLKRAFGAILLVASTLVLTGYDKRIEALFLDHAPQWLVILTTRF